MGSKRPSNNCLVHFYKRRITIMSSSDSTTLDSNSNSMDQLDHEDMSQEDHEEKARLIAQVLELQNTLEDLSSRVDNVKEENMRLRSENQVLGQYIENLMSASKVFQGTER